MNPKRIAPNLAISFIECIQVSNQIIECDIP